MPPTRRADLFAALLTGAASLILFAVPAAAGGDPGVQADEPAAIELLGGSLRPGLEMRRQGGRALAERAAELAASGVERMHVLLQLAEIPDRAAREELWRQGIHLGAYIPHRAWVASVPVDGAARLAQRRDVSYLAPWDAALKLHPRVTADDWSSHAVLPQGVAVEKGLPGAASGVRWVMLFVQLHHDLVGDAAPAAGGPPAAVPLHVPASMQRTMEELAAAHGGVALGWIQGLGGATVWLPEDRIAGLAAEEAVLWIEEGPPPLSPVNDGVQRFSRTDRVQASPYRLDGSGTSIFIYDGGQVAPDHSSFAQGAVSRLSILDDVGISDHPTHVAGIAAGDGDGGRGEGMAPAASLLTGAYQQTIGPDPFYETSGDIENNYDLARNGFGIDIGNNSIGSNTATNGYPCSREGDYGVMSAMVDGIARGDNQAVGGPVVLVWAAGNERAGGVPRGRCGAGHSTVAPPSCAKNPLHVGAVRSDGGAMTLFSSWGPCDDGRLKPLVVTAGCESGRVTGEGYIFSALAGADPFGGPGWCGTSMASPAVAGMAALMLQEWRRQSPGGSGAVIDPSLVKALFIQTARDLGAPGPDYQFGYGAVDIQAAIDLLRAGGVPGAADGGTSAWGLEEVGQGGTDRFDLTVPPGSRQLKVSLAWDDSPAAAFAENALVNDLDLWLEAPDGTVHRPWVLDPSAAHGSAEHGLNRIDNQEQAVVERPAAGGWSVVVRGAAVPQGPQPYALTYSVTPGPRLACFLRPIAGDFEAGSGAWQLTGASLAAAPVAGHGASSLLLGGEVNVDESAVLTLSLPAGAARISWRYSWMMETEEGDFGNGWDYFHGELLSGDGQQTLEAFDFRNDGWPPGVWMEQGDIDLTAWAGDTVRLSFSAENEGSLPTAFWIDDVEVEVCFSIPLEAPLLVPDDTVVGTASQRSRRDR